MTVNIIKKAIVFICLLLSSSALFAQEPFRGAVGVGGGMLYGFGAGARFDYRLSEHISIGVGQGGYTPTTGLRFHFRSQRKLWQPRLGLHYGTIESVDLSRPETTGGYSRKTYDFRDFAAEVGQGFHFGAARRHAVDLSVTFALGDGGEDKKREELGASNGWLESVDNAFDAINIGYSYHF